ncbi:Ig-like domain-containing protein [Paenibacillus nasutitermitis]|uniref:SLH domain-containing protein n=1 Tax=Paenibacillus nasutitermitis TaxID=1652958 RepID=A0A917DQH4_9BACL|nr:Ig-like domain-containing protein [Paenibacillus nasutitermitis]GGD57063.1 hypothetical protein GCM10010911_13530 [Paenibacillus nasutitermitis]
MRRLQMIILSVLILLAGLPLTQAGAAELNTEQKFQFLRNEGIFTGFSDGSSRLGEAMSREQFATVLFRLWELKEEAVKPTYSDVLKTRWSYGEIEAVTKSGLMKGMGAGKFGPAAKVTVEQLAAVLVRAYGNTGGGSTVVYGKVSAWAKTDVSAALDKSWIPEQSDYTVVARRSLLVEASYAVYLDMNPGLNPDRDSLDAESVTAKSATSVQIKLKYPVQSAIKEQFVIADTAGNTLSIRNVALNAAGTIATLTTDKQTAGMVYRLYAAGKSWTFTGASDDQSKPKIVSSKINGDASITVVFSEPVESASAEKAANYKFNNDLTITRISLGADKKTVTILTQKQKAGTLYTLIVTNVKDLAGNVMDPGSPLYFGAVVDNTPPAITKISAGTNKVVLTFSEKLDPLYAENPAYYFFDGGLGLATKAVYKDSDRTVTLSTGNQVTGKSYKVTVYAVRDLTGNVIADSTQRSFSGNGASQVATIAVETIRAVNENTVEVAFSKSLKGISLSTLKLTVLTNDGASVSTTGWKYYLARKEGNDKIISFQIRTADNSNPTIFRQGHVYIASVSGIVGLQTADNANRKSFAGIDMPNLRPYATGASASNNKTVTVYFSEPVKNVSAGAFRITGSDGKTVVIASDQLKDKTKIVTQVTLNLGGVLQSNKIYRVSFVSGVTDAAGWNALKNKEGTATYYVTFNGTDTPR